MEALDIVFNEIDHRADITWSGHREGLLGRRCSASDPGRHGGRFHLIAALLQRSMTAGGRRRRLTAVVGSDPGSHDANR
jgi:hypothetical protein